MTAATAITQAPSVTHNNDTLANLNLLDNYGYVVVDDRCNHSIYVDLVYCAYFNALYIVVTNNDMAHATEIPLDKAKDAFEHPYCYIGRN